MQSIEYAKYLAHKHNKKIYIKNYPKNLKFTEKDARDFRHNLFESLIINEGYESVITGHQLNDKLEWFLMQLSKGAGTVELLGMNESIKKTIVNEETKETIQYNSLKPLC